MALVIVSLIVFAPLGLLLKDLVRPGKRTSAGAAPSYSELLEQSGRHSSTPSARLAA